MLGHRESTYGGERVAIESGHFMIPFKSGTRHNIKKHLSRRCRRAARMQLHNQDNW